MGSVKYLYKFLDAGLKSHYDGSAWEVGEWRTVPAPTRECQGLNACEYIQDAMGYVQGSILAKVARGGKTIKGSDKWTCERIRIVETVEWGKVESVRLAVFCAELVLAKFEETYPNDNRPWLAIEAAKAWLADPTAKNTRAAEAAAGARAAARVAGAAGAAAEAAAGAAEAAWAATEAATWAAGAAWAATEAATWAAGAAAGKKIHAYCLSLVGWSS